MTNSCYPYGIRQQPREEPKPRVKFCHKFDSSASNDVNRCWKNVWKNTDGSDESATLRSYKDAVTRVETQARTIYEDDDLRCPRSDDFVNIMIYQGCFILQVALYALGCGEHLGSPEDPIFHQARVRDWVTSIFCIWKQFPLLVLKEFMKQSFFQKVLKSRKVKRPRDLQRMVLYDFLVEPMLDSPGSKLMVIRRRFLSLVNCKDPSPQEPPTLLHALWLFLTGPYFGNDVDVEEEDGTAWSTVRSATELKKLGITFRCNKGLGTRGITFQKQMLDAVLYLPSISIDPSSKTLFENLINYEKDFDKKRPEVRAYLKLMQELIRSPNDAKIFATHGIIHADPKREEELHTILWSLPLPEVVNNYNLGIVRHQIRSYIKPIKWKKLRDLLCITIVLALVQAIYSVLSFHLKK